METPPPKLDRAEWEGDAMSRRRYAQFLDTYIQKRSSGSGASLTVALDAAWGTGKTFFVQKWAGDLEKDKRGVITFDAWQNDFAAEPLLSFMSELASGMDVLRSKAPNQTALKRKLLTQGKSLLVGFRRAALPAAGVVAKGLLTKVTGVAFDAIVESVRSGDMAAFSEKDWAKIADDAEVDIQKGLEAFFEKSLEDHKARAKAANAFKKSLQSLVETLHEAHVVSKPLYIFVDELDRCRPDYAIRLLEGIKHLFSVPGVVFVVSTNLEQLSKSVQAIYGVNFDGRGYLKRFFDFEFTLPDPDTYSFAQVLMKDDALLADRDIDLGIDTDAYRKDVYLARSFELISTAFKLSLRDQRQVGPSRLLHPLRSRETPRFQCSGYSFSRPSDIVRLRNLSS